MNPNAVIKDLLLSEWSPKIPENHFLLYEMHYFTFLVICDLDFRGGGEYEYLHWRPTDQMLIAC